MKGSETELCGGRGKKGVGQPLTQKAFSKEAGLSLFECALNVESAEFHGANELRREIRLLFWI